MPGPNFQCRVYVNCHQHWWNLSNWTANFVGRVDLAQRSIFSISTATVSKSVVDILSSFLLCHAKTIENPVVFVVGRATVHRLRTNGHKHTSKDKRKHLSALITFEQLESYKAKTNKEDDGENLLETKGCVATGNPERHSKSRNHWSPNGTRDWTL